MTDRILNWGLLSTAHINRALIKPLNASKRNRLLAVASRSQTSADTYAREWKIPRAHGSYEALLNDSEIDVIYNSLPNHLHAEWTIKALRAGKNVLCEKPFAISLAEVDAMTQAANETGKVLAEAFMYRHHVQTLKVKEIVDSGKLGKIQLIKGAFTYTIKNENDIRNFKDMGGGSIWDVGCYPISYARTIVGAEPVEVFGWQVTGPSGSDEIFVGQMKFRDGIHTQFDSGFKSPYRSYIEIVGTDASLNIPNPFKPGVKNEIYLTRDGKTQKINIKGEELYLGEVEDMYDSVIRGKSPRVTLADSRENIAVILALLESAQSGKLVIV
ncbi:MAG: Gfo/Idh/MocA family oxidoreductase [Anaerolineales bacterium]|nr:Gfo/Idh/MocA family oxidoreductase [Anaerolineales bacterium]